MPMKVTLKKNRKTYIELYYLDSFLGRIELCDSNRITQSNLILSMQSDIKIVIKKPIDKKEDGNYAIED